MTSSDDISNSTIQTFTGVMFNVFEPDPELIEIKDISHALSMLCRYGGHSRMFYSVAEHCVHMAKWFVEEGSIELARAALLHDATEAYMGDLVRPIKLQMPTYRMLEDILQKIIFTKYGVVATMPDAVRDADLRICNDERRMLLDDRPWVIDHLPPLGVNIQGWYPIEAEENWLDTYWRLFL